MSVLSVNEPTSVYLKYDAPLPRGVRNTKNITITTAPSISCLIVVYSIMATPSSKADDDSCCSGISIDDDVAFAFVDFTGVDFGDDDDDDEKKAQEESAKGSSAEQQSINIEQYKKQREHGDQQQQISKMPDGQNLKEREVHDPQLFKAQTRRVENLCKWYELGIRPSLSSSSLLNRVAHQQKDDDLFASEVDNLPNLLLRSIEAQDDLNANLPPHPLGEYEDSLKVAPSTIEGAGNGLFAKSHIP